MEMDLTFKNQMVTEGMFSVVITAGGNLGNKS